MFLTLPIPWQLINIHGEFWRPITVPAGTYEVERVANPFGMNNEAWLVIKGTSLGGSESFFHQCNLPILGDFRVAIDDA